MKLTIEQIRKNDNIPTSEIEQDIAETQKEIDDYKEELATLMKRPSENKLRIFVLRGEILLRKDFIENLQCILNYRKEND